MGTLEAAILLVVAIGGFGWAAIRMLRGSVPPNEGSARAETYAAGSGYAAEQSDNVRNFDR